jgi:hypothetical protein
MRTQGDASIPADKKAAELEKLQAQFDDLGRRIATATN